MDQEYVVVLRLRRNRWAIMDIEYIQCTRSHKCIRKLYIMTKDGVTFMEMEFFPCKLYEELERKYQRSFKYCYKHIHKLPYYPQEHSAPCSTALEKVDRFITDNGIELILFKGGIVERNLCQELAIPSFNIEFFRKLVKANSHEPSEEVNCYYNQLVMFGCCF